VSFDVALPAGAPHAASAPAASEAPWDEDEGAWDEDDE
jgi:hypothetical protein